MATVQVSITIPSELKARARAVAYMHQIRGGLSGLIAQALLKECVRLEKSPQTFETQFVQAFGVFPVTGDRLASYGARRYRYDYTGARTDFTVPGLAEAYRTGRFDAEVAAMITTQRAENERDGHASALAPVGCIAPALPGVSAAEPDMPIDDAPLE